MSTDGAYSEFFRRWGGPSANPLVATLDDLDTVEARLETYLPESYREFVGQVGAFNTGSLLADVLIERNLDLPMIQAILSPTEIIESTEGWREAGLPKEFVAFAEEGGGDHYCFAVVEESEPRPADAIVWYFDHEERSMECLDIPFKKWIYAYTRIPE